MNKQQKFYSALKDLFIGAKLEGEGGYVNLMNIKSEYFDKIWRKLEEDIKTEFEGEKDFLFDHLNTFFENYFSDGGSIFFSSTPVYKNIYAKVYSDREDTALFWKTQNLYYVKSEADYKSIKGLALRDYDIFKFDFDASSLEHKKANEKKELEFLFTGFNKETKTLKFKVRYKEQPKYDELKKILGAADTEKVKEYLLQNYPKINNQNIKVIENCLDLRRLNFKSNTKDTVKADFIIKERADKLFSVVEVEAAVTDAEQVVKYLKKDYESINEDKIKKAFSIYKKQSEIDYFIHKDAKVFLREQFNLFIYQYLTDDFDTVFDGKRLDLIRKTKKIAYKTIDYIAGFEDELKRIWNKPKFVRRSNYVITLDRIFGKGGIALIKKLLEHKGFEEQVKEWVALGIVKDDFDRKKVFANSLNGKLLSDEFKHLPVDTKYFNDLKIEILGLFDDLDNELDGWLIHSENYQALNTILPKFREKIQTIYIDPPFNLGTNADFQYNVNYKDANWITLLENRINLARDLINEKGSMFVRCDYNGNMFVRLLMNKIFGEENFRNEIILSKSAKVTEQINRYHSGHDSLFSYTKSDKYDFKTATKKRETLNWRGMHLPGIRWSPLPQEYVKLFSKEKLQEKNGNFVTKARIISGKELLPPEGRHWALSQKDIFELEKEGKIKIGENGEPQTEEPEFQKLTDNWTDWVGYSSHWGFATENHEKVIERAIKTSSLKEYDTILDFFLGSGTTTAVAHKLNRKWLGVEMGEHFYTVILPRMKKVLAYDKSGVSGELKDYQGGGFFKYYELEQYEDTLRNACYRPLPDDKNIAKIDFKINEKLAEKGLKIDYDKEKAYFRFENIYDDVDIIETISNTTGWKIKKVAADKATYFDELTGSEKEVDLNNITVEEYPFLKTLIWW